MKTFSSLFTVLSTAALLLAGCVNEEPNYKKNPGSGEKPSDATGFLIVGDMNMRVVYDSQTETDSDDAKGEATFSAPRVTPAVDDFIVEIVDDTGATVERKTYGAWKARTEPIELAVGSYMLKAYSEDTIADAGWDCPVYRTEKEFQIRKGETTSMPDLVCTLSNIKVTVGYAADLAEILSDDTSAEVALGANKLIFVKGDVKTAYFRAMDETNTLEITVTGSFRDSGKPVTLSKTLEGVRGGQWRKVTLIIENADKGKLEIGIVVDSFIQDEEIVIDGTKDLWEPVIDEPDPTQPTIQWKGHDLASPYPLAASNTDDPVVFDLDAPNGITAFVVRFGSDNGELLTALSDMGIDSEFDLCTITPESGAIHTALSDLGLPLGDAVKEQKTMTLELTALMPLLYRFNGTHTIALEMTDGEATRSAGSVAEATLTVVVGPQIVWEGYDIDQSQKLTADMTIVIDVTSANPIASFEVTIDSKILEGYLDNILPTYFDLCTAEGELAKQLGDLGFPTGSQVVAPLSFDITQFVELLIDMPAGEHKFILKVTDTAGKAAEKTLHLINEK